MTRTLLRRVSMVAVAATSGAVVLGVDQLGASLEHKRPLTAQVALVGVADDTHTLGPHKGRLTETHRLMKQRAQAHARTRATRLSLRRTAAARADRLRRLGTPSGARSLGREMAAAKGWGATQFSCLDSLWTNESAWQVRAQNASGAYGIPQALPGPRLAGAGADWRTNPVTQIRWGLDYIGQRYGVPCGAWAYWQNHHWY